MPRYQKKIYAGCVYECEEYFSPRTIGKSYTRGVKENMTPEEQKKINLRQARKKLSRLINTNFKTGDVFLTLTHSTRLSYAEAKKELTKFIRRVKRLRKKQGLADLKYIAVTEHQEKREHHHIVMSGGLKMTLEDWDNLWGLGIVLPSLLRPGSDFIGLAHYITKEPAEKQKRRWCQSLNLAQPRVVVQKMRSLTPCKKIKPPKGYQLIERYEYFSEVTGDIRYIKAIRLGGEDWAEGGRSPQEQVEQKE